MNKLNSDAKEVMKLINEKTVDELNISEEELINEMIKECMTALKKNSYRYSNSFSAIWDVDDYISDVLENVWKYKKSFDCKKGNFEAWF